MTIQPYSREFFAPRPNRAVLFLRTFPPWQLVRFVWINLKMVRMIWIGYHGHEPLRPITLFQDEEPKPQLTPHLRH